MEEPVHRTRALTFDPTAAQAWLQRPSDTDGFTRAESLGVDNELTGPGGEGFLATVDDVLAAQPDGLHRRADITRVQLWLIPDGDILDQGAIISVDLTSGIRLATLHQDIKDFADRDQRGIPSVLSALAHIANQVSLLLDTYQTANPQYRAETEVAYGGAAATTNDTRPVQPAPAAFTEQQIGAALNRAADDILAAVHAGDEGLRDAMNLIVNAAMAYLTGQARNLRQVVEQGYEADYAQVLSWIEVAV